MKVYLSRDEYYVPTFNRQDTSYPSCCVDVPDNIVKRWERAEAKMEEAWGEMREYMKKAAEQERLK